MFGRHRRELELGERERDHHRQLGLRARQRQGRRRHPNAVDSAAPNLPTDVTTDVITGSTNDIPVLLLAASTDLPVAASGELVQNTAVPALTTIEGVRQVEVTGEDTTQLTVTLLPAELTKNDLTAAAVTQAVQSQLTVIPAGTAYDKTLELAVQVGNSTTSVKQVQALARPDHRRAGAALPGSPTSRSSRSRPPRWPGPVDGPPSASRCSRRPTVTRWRSRTPWPTRSPVWRRPWATTRPSRSSSTRRPDRAVDPRPHRRGRFGLLFAVLVILLFLLSVRSTSSPPSPSRCRC